MGRDELVAMWGWFRDVVAAMNTSDRIATLGLLVSILDYRPTRRSAVDSQHSADGAARSAAAAEDSAKAAQRTADETRRANRIAFHDGRINVLKALLELRKLLTQHGGGIGHRAV